jgi:hypothetical protein
MYRNCQSCGNAIFSVNDYGTESDGRLNRDYCSNCYKGGQFYSRDWKVGDANPAPMSFTGWYNGYSGFAGMGFYIGDEN